MRVFIGEQNRECNSDTIFFKFIEIFTLLDNQVIKIGSNK